MPTAIEIYHAHKSPVPRGVKKSGNDTFAEHMASKAKKPSKYRNKWVVIDGINFQSQGEGFYYLELKDRLSRGELREIKRQIPFEFEVNGVVVGKYVADFGVLHHNGLLEIIDYKSRFTVTLALYQMKKSLMVACYGVFIKEVGKK